MADESSSMKFSKNYGRRGARRDCRNRAHGSSRALPVSIAVEKMTDLGLLTTRPHPPEVQQSQSRS